MSPAERRALLGESVVELLHREVEAAPPPPPEVIEALRPIFTRPAVRRRSPALTADAA